MYAGKPAMAQRAIDAAELANRRQQLRQRLAADPAERVTASDEGPKFDPTAFVANTAVLSGRIVAAPHNEHLVRLRIRRCGGAIVIGDRTNVQDNSVLRCTPGARIVLGQDTTIGHNVTMADCTIGDRCLIGIGNVVAPGRWSRTTCSSRPEPHLARPGTQCRSPTAASLRASSAARRGEARNDRRHDRHLYDYAEELPGCSSRRRRHGDATGCSSSCQGRTGSRGPGAHRGCVATMIDSRLPPVVSACSARWWRRVRCWPPASSSAPWWCSTASDGEAAGGRYLPDLAIPGHRDARRRAHRQRPPRSSFPDRPTAAPVRDHADPRSDAGQQPFQIVPLDGGDQQEKILQAYVRSRSNWTRGRRSRPANTSAPPCSCDACHQDRTTGSSAESSNPDAWDRTVTLAHTITGENC